MHKSESLADQSRFAPHMQARGASDRNPEARYRLCSLRRLCKDSQGGCRRVCSAG